MTAPPAPPTQLIEYLKTAAHLEHCLLDAYTFAACTIKSTPEEFNSPRGAIQFEKCRKWKTAILSVCHEEMGHLHYVQSLLRCVGAAAEFQLPPRTENNTWRFDTWIQQEGGDPVEVPVSPLTTHNIQQFMRYEAADAVGEDPFSPALLALYEQIRQFEFELFVQGTFLGVADETARTQLINNLKFVYDPPVDARSAKHWANKVVTPEPIFASIADFYNNLVVPGFSDAFANGQVVLSNQRLNNELGLSTAPAAQGFMPLVPVARSLAYTGNNLNATKHYNVPDNVQSIINSIVDEGEGYQHFAVNANEMLGNIGPGKLIDFRTYQQVQAEKAKSLANGGEPVGPVTPLTPAQEDAINQSLNLRNSHFYRFALIFSQIEQERLHDHTFQPYRTALDTSVDPELQAIRDTISPQFNNCYLVMLAWLSRLYEVKFWAADQRQRSALSMLVTWPLMSMAVRPMLELASFFLPLSETYKVFNISPGSLTGDDALALEAIFSKTKILDFDAANDAMDTLGVNILDQAGTWAQQKLVVVTNNTTIHAIQKKIIIARLSILTRLSEFKAQFAFRVAGGYSNTVPTDPYYQQTAENQNFSAYEENPEQDMFLNTMLLRLRFGGFVNVNLATDPDPPCDEVGASGTIMYHAADSYDNTPRWFDRSIVSIVGDTKAIQRQPADQLPALGLHLQDAAVVVASAYSGNGIPLGNTVAVDKFTAGAVYVPTGTMDSAGAVQASGVQQNMQPVGFREVWNVPTDQLPINVNLFPKNQGTPTSLVYPYLNGDNHVMWQDGEPIDPFILGIEVGGAQALQREIYNNNGVTFFEFTPIQRIQSARAPVGFGGLDTVPAWAHQNKNYQYTPLEQLLGSQDPFSYVNTRIEVLLKQLATSLGVPQAHQSIALPQVQRVSKGIGSLSRNPVVPPKTWKNKGTFEVNHARTTEQTARQTQPTTAELSSNPPKPVEHVAAGSAPRAFSQQEITTIAGYVARLNLLNFAPTTTINWLPATLTYGHSVSGIYSQGAGVAAINNVIDPKAPHLSLGASIQTPNATPNRDVANSRWLVKYTLGMMDTDAIRTYMYGEVYIPLSSSDNLSYSWEILFPSEELPNVLQFATNFQKPFWGNYTNITSSQRSGSWVTSPLTVPISENFQGNVTSGQQVIGYQYSANILGTTNPEDVTCAFNAIIKTADGDTPEFKRLMWTLTVTQVKPPYLPTASLLAIIGYFEDDVKKNFGAKFGFTGPVPSKFPNPPQ